MTVEAPAAFACGTNGRYFVGIETTGLATQGARADIDRYDPRIPCATSAAWSMINNTVSGGAAQVGWTKWAAWSTTAVFYFYEYGPTPVMIATVPDPTNLVTDKYTVYEQSGEFYFLINGVQKENVALSWTPNQDQWMAETHWSDDQTAGDTINLVEFAAVDRYSGGIWYGVDDPADYYYNSSLYGSASLCTSNCFYTWDDRYSSEG